MLYGDIDGSNLEIFFEDYEAVKLLYRLLQQTVTTLPLTYNDIIKQFANFG